MLSFLALLAALGAGFLAGKSAEEEAVFGKTCEACGKKFKSLQTIYIVFSNSVNVSSPYSVDISVCAGCAIEAQNSKSGVPLALQKHVDVVKLYDEEPVENLKLKSPEVTTKSGSQERQSQLTRSKSRKKKTSS